MFALITNFANLLFASLLVGAMFGVQLFMNPAGLTAASYIVLQQQGIRKFNNKLPVLGAATILVTIGAAMLARTDGRRVYLLSAAAVCFIAAGLVTRFLNQPLNAVVMTWRAETYPLDWTTLRDEWWRGHMVRLASGLLGLSLVIAAALMRE
jgi:Domain of unknown function (DUF1772)